MSEDDVVNDKIHLVVDGADLYGAYRGREDANFDAAILRHHSRSVVEVLTVPVRSNPTLSADSSETVKRRGGRPHKGDRHLLQSRVPRALAARVQADAAGRGLTVSDLVAQILLAHYEERVDPREATAETH